MNYAFEDSNSPMSEVPTVTIVNKLFWISSIDTFEGGPFYNALRIIYKILMTLGFITNFWTLCILLKSELRNQRKFLLIISMTVVDMLTCVSVFLSFNAGDISKMSDRGPFMWLMCHFVATRYLGDALMGISSWHLVAISIERYISLKNKGKNKFEMLVIIWVYGLG